MYEIVQTNLTLQTPGITQASDGAGGTLVTLAGTYTAPFGQVPLNVVLSDSDQYKNVNVVPVAGANAWTINATLDFPNSQYPMPATTIVGVLSVILG
jgi:hypothetical protein